MSKPAKASILTPQERAILRLVRQGYRNREIAGDLALSVGVVDTHLRQIADKLRAQDRLQLAAFAEHMDL